MKHHLRLPTSESVWWVEKDALRYLSGWKWTYRGRHSLYEERKAVIFQKLPQTPLVFLEMSRVWSFKWPGLDFQCVNTGITFKWFQTDCTHFFVRPQTWMFLNGTDSFEMSGDFTRTLQITSEFWAAHFRHALLSINVTASQCVSPHKIIYWCRDLVCTLF